MPRSVHFCETCYHPDDGGISHLRNVGKILCDHSAQKPRGQPSSLKMSCICDVSCDVPGLYRGFTQILQQNVEMTVDVRKLEVGTTS